MYAIVEIGGTQCKVSKSDIVRVPKMDTEPGKTLNLDKVLLIVPKLTIIQIQNRYHCCMSILEGYTPPRLL